MRKTYLPLAAIIAVVLLLCLLLSGIFYTVDQTEQVIITQFGEPVGNPVTSPGLHFKMPFVQTVNSLDKRFLEWDGAPVAIPTRDKTYIHVNTFARWRIEDPKLYFVRLHDERSAQSRLEDILGSETRNSIAKHDLIEIVRTDKDRQPVHDDTLTLIARAFDRNPAVDAVIGSYDSQPGCGSASRAAAIATPARPP